MSQQCGLLSLAINCKNIVFCFHCFGGYFVLPSYSLYCFPQVPLSQDYLQQKKQSLVQNTGLPRTQATLTLYPAQTCSCLRKRQDLCGGSWLCQGGIPIPTFVCSFSLAAAGLAYPFPHSTPPLHESQLPGEATLSSCPVSRAGEQKQGCCSVENVRGYFVSNSTNHCLERKC